MNPTWNARVSNPSVSGKERTKTMTETEFETLCESKHHLSMIANRDGNYEVCRYGFYPNENDFDNLIPVIERTPKYILGLLGNELNDKPLWERDVPLFSKTTPPLIIADTDSATTEEISRYIEYAVNRIKNEICQVCGKPGAYTTLVDQKRHICFKCREKLGCNQTGWKTSNPEADNHGGKGY